MIKYCLLVCCLLLNGCATTSSNNPEDPLESINRPIYTFNRTLDKAILRPVAKGYNAITPEPVQKGVTNFFENLDDITTAVNGLLQGKVTQSGSDTLRVLVNSTIGIGGLFDVASSWGMDKNDEDFGQTLGYWGFDTGAYLMLPFFGPSSIRDGTGKVFDYRLDPYNYTDHVPTKNTVRGFDLLDKRSHLLDFDSQLEDAIDEYAFVRDAYLQNRKFKVFDGNPPEDDEQWLVDECYEENEKDCKK
jgi:phospholipid-binding lipoprotein MlaA